MTNRARWVSRAAPVTALLGLVTTAPAQPADAPAGVAVVVGNARSRRPTSSRAASRVDPGSAQQHGSTNREETSLGQNARRCFPNPSRLSCSGYAILATAASVS